MTSLREYHRTTGDDKVKVQVGDIVQIQEDSRRVNWKTGIVEKLNYGSDGLARSALVRTKTGITSRPITKLYPLEVNQNDEFPTITQTSDEARNRYDDRKLPIRKCAIKAKEKIKTWTKRTEVKDSM